MSKRILTSGGNIIDLDRGEGIESIPPESLQMDKHSYGAYYLPSQSFSVKFNGMFTTIRKGYGQFFDKPEGERRLLTEFQDMKKFPRVFPVSLGQRHNGDVYYTIYVTINGISHKLVLTYDRDHPNYQIQAVIEHPRLDRSRMIGHWYSEGKPCYIENWKRSWTALKVGTQVVFWLNDYYGDYDDDSNPFDDSSNDYDDYDDGYDNLSTMDKIMGRRWRIF